MLTEIREKTQGTFAWVILILICVPFALWGLQNYTDGGREQVLVTVGDKEFSQRDVSQAYEQFRQQYSEMQVPEEVLRKQAVEKMIGDELLLQHVVAEKLSITDVTVRKFISSLPYFQKDGKFDKKQYETLLEQQGMSPGQFVNRIRQALLMEQYQKAITDTSFVSEQSIATFFKIQNQSREIEYVTVKVVSVTSEPSEEEIKDYFQKNADIFQTEEKLSLEYIKLSLTELMEDISISEEQIGTYYDDNIALYSSKERRKVSHILFAKNKATTEEQALAKAKEAQSRLKQSSFFELAKELSDDTLTAKEGGDLGLFVVGGMDPEFEKVAAKLVLNEVSEPVKSAFGYHLITVTELAPSTTKVLVDVKDEVSTAIKRAEAETIFYELGESLTELSFESSDNLVTVANDLGLNVEKTALFTRNLGDGIASEKEIRNAAFSEAVLKGNNSEPIELGDDRLVVIRLLDRLPAEIKPLEEVRSGIVTTIQVEGATNKAKEDAETIKQQILLGKEMSVVAQEFALDVTVINDLRRDNKDIPWLVTQAVFKAAKPVAGKTTVLRVDSSLGEQVVVNLLGVKEGRQTEEDKEKAQLAIVNITRALGQSDYAAVIDGIRGTTDISIRN